MAVFLNAQQNFIFAEAQNQCLHRSENQNFVLCTLKDYFEIKRFVSCTLKDYFEMFPLFCAGGQFAEVYRGLDREYTFTGLSPGHLYRIRFAALSDGGISEVS